ILLAQAGLALAQAPVLNPGGGALSERSSSLGTPAKGTGNGWAAGQAEPLRPGIPLSPEGGIRPGSMDLLPPPPFDGGPARDALPATHPELNREVWDAPSCARCNCWFAAEYLLWWEKKGPLPFPLVVTDAATAR